MKRKLSVLLALVLTFASPLQAIAQVGPQGFSDMPKNWSTEALTQAVDNGLLLGHDGKLNPNNNLSRAEMAVVINRAFGATERADISGYTDVKSIDWFYDEMSKAVGMRTFQGYANQLRPNDPINREEVFVVLSKVLKLEAEDSNKRFSDIDEISEWAKPSVFALINEGYINGSGGKVNPKAHITRAEFAQVMHNIIKDYVNTSEVYEEVSEGNVVVNVPNATLKNVVIKGDLIIADGVGEGEVTLENVKVEGRVLVRGGGENSIIIRGDTEIDTIIIVKNGNKVRILNETGAEIAVATVEGEADVILEGKFKNVVVQSPDITVLARGTEIDKVEVNGTRSIVIVNENSKIEEVTIRANRVTIEGEGEVKEAEVEAGGSGTSIITPQTQINVDRGANDVTGTGGVEIGANETYVNGKERNEDAKPLTQSSSDGNSSGSSGTTTSPVTKYTVNYSVVGEGGTLEASVSNGGTAQEGSSVSFTAIPDEGYRLKEWTVNGEVIDWLTGLNVSRDMDMDVDVKVEFESISVETHALTYEVVGGNGTISGNVESGASVPHEFSAVLTATPSEGYRIKNWTYAGVDVFTEGNVYELGVGQDLHITVEFEIMTYTINYSVIGGNGNITASSTSYATVTDGMVVDGGTDITFTSEPDSGYRVKDWKVNGTSMGSSLSIDLGFISEDTTVILEFEEIPVVTYPLSITVTPSDATVTVTDSSDSVITGTFSVNQWTYDLPVGIYDIKIEKEGYITHTDTQNMIGPSSHIITLEEMSDDLRNINLKGGTYDENIIINGFEFTPTNYEYLNVIIPYKFTTAGNSDYFDISIEENTTDGNSTLQINETEVDINSYGRIYINEGETKTIEIMYTQTDKAPKIYTIEISRSTDVELINIAGETSVLYDSDKHGFLVEKETITKEDFVVSDGATVTLYENITNYINNIEIESQSVTNNPGVYDEFVVKITGADGITTKIYKVGVTRKIELLETSSFWTNYNLSVYLIYSGPLNSGINPDASQFSISINGQERVSYQTGLRGDNNQILNVQFNNPAGITTESAIGILNYTPNATKPVKDSAGNLPKESDGPIEVALERKPVAIVSAEAEKVDINNDGKSDLRIMITYDGTLMEVVDSNSKGQFKFTGGFGEEGPEPNQISTDGNKLYLIYNDFYERNNVTLSEYTLRYVKSSNLSIKDNEGRDVISPNEIIVNIPE